MPGTSNIGRKLLKKYKGGFVVCKDDNGHEYKGDKSFDHMGYPVVNKAPLTKEAVEYLSKDCIKVFEDDSSGRRIGKDGGMKNDKDKTDWSIFKPLFKVVEGVVRILMYGEKKYKRNNWMKVDINRNFAALMRHLTKWADGEDLDQESKLHHLDHALCDLMFIRWKIKNEVKK